MVGIEMHGSKSSTTPLSRTEKMPKRTTHAPGRSRHKPAENPKSAILKTDGPGPPVTKIFSGFRSPCTRFRSSWRYVSASTTPPNNLVQTNTAALMEVKRKTRCSLVVVEDRSEDWHPFKPTAERYQRIYVVFFCSRIFSSRLKKLKNK